MTKYYYTCKEDKGLVDRAFNNISWLIFGKNKPDKIKAFRELFEMEVKQVSVYPQGKETEYLKKNISGICRVDKKDNKIIIEMQGLSLATPNQHDRIKHTSIHEFCHAFADLLPLIFAKDLDGVIRDGVLCKSHMGLIKETNPITGEPVGQHFYGKMFNETMMDIITAIGSNAFNSNNRITADDILNKPYSESGNYKTSYAIFTSLTRLAIAAFSNNGFINYQNLINSGHGIFDVTTKMKNGESYKANDFLYGILFDPLHIEKEFDKFMGDGYYRDFCEYLDRIFITCQRGQKIPVQDIKNVMGILPEFLNKKMDYYLKNGIIDKRGADQIVGNFNIIWNSMQVEYESYFTQEDIDDIAKRSGR